MSDEPTPRGIGASPALRDRFLNALDGNDYAALRVLCADLRNCSDILPGSVCVSLGVPRGSTYAIAAMSIVAA
jgi:hypothetical protein